MYCIIIKALLLILLINPRTYAFVRSVGSLDSEGKPVFVSWAKGSIPITYVINERTSTSLLNITKDSNPIEAIISAFNSWDSIPTSFISFKFGGKTPISNAAADGVNLITFVDPSFSDPAALAITITTWAQGAGSIRLPDGRVFEASFPGQILDADIIFDSTDIFSTTALPDAVDLESVAAHEIGHFLGLDHTAILSSTMLPFTPGGTIRQRTLDVDDIAGASSIYPEDGFSSATGSIQGKIKSSRDGSRVFGAGVVAVDSFGRPTISTVSFPDGSYTIPGLSPGNYSLMIEPLDGPVIARDFLDFFDIFSKVSSPSPFFTTQFFGSEGTLIKVEPHSATGPIDISVNLDLPPSINITHLGIIKREGRRISITSTRFMGVNPGEKIGLAILGSGVGSSTSISFSGSGITSSVDPSVTSSFEKFFSSFGGGIALNVDISPEAMAGPRNIIASNGSVSSVLVGGLEIEASLPKVIITPLPKVIITPKLVTLPVPFDLNISFQFSSGLSSIRKVTAVIGEIDVLPFLLPFISSLTETSATITLPNLILPSGTMFNLVVSITTLQGTSTGILEVAVP